MGQLKYLSAIQYIDVVLGNSSSGIIEAPSFGKPTVNIGARQEGRAKAESIIDCSPEKESIINALKKAFSAEFKEFCKTVKNLYGKGNSSVKILKILKKEIDNVESVKKTFFDLEKF